jgi:hypothetical protein
VGKRKGQRRPIATIHKITDPLKSTEALPRVSRPGPGPDCAKATKQTNDRRSSFRIGWETFWAFVGPIISVFGVAQYYWPSVTITTGVNLSPREIFQTQFIVTNTGHMSVYNVSFRCALVGTSLKVGVVSTGNDLAKIPELLPNHPASRGCFGRSLIENGPWLKVSADYKWPLIGLVSTETAFFSAKATDKGEVQLVPEAAPPSNWMQFFDFRSPEN